MSGLIQLDGCALDLERGIVVGADQTVALTHREIVLLRLLLSQQGSPVSRSQIERDVWDMHAGTRSRAVPQAVHRLRRKLESTPDSPRNLLTVPGVGWKLVVPEQNGAAGSRTQLEASGFFEMPDVFERFVDALDRTADIVVLTGAAGVGKTRLITAGLRATTGAAPALFVPCQGLTRVSALEHRLLETTESTTIAGMVSNLRPGAIVLDSVEYLVDENPAGVAEFLLRIPRRVLATSRLPLHADGVINVHLQALEVPPEGLGWTEAAQAPAVQFLLRRCRQVTPQFEAADVGTSVIQLVRAIDGVPLALELAAARMKILTPLEMLERLDPHDGARAAERRLPSEWTRLEEGLTHSWALLNRNEQELAAHCAAFRGGFDLETLRWLGQVADEHSIQRRLESLERLGFVRRERYGWRMALLMQRFVATRGDIADVHREARKRHLSHHLKLRSPEQLRQAVMDGTEDDAILASNAVELEAAARFALDSKDMEGAGSLRLAAAIGRGAGTQTAALDLSDRVDELLPHLTPEMRATLQLLQAESAGVQGDIGAARHALQHAVRDLGEPVIRRAQELVAFVSATLGRPDVVGQLGAGVFPSPFRASSGPIRTRLSDASHRVLQRVSAASVARRGWAWVLIAEHGPSGDEMHQAGSALRSILSNPDIDSIQRAGLLTALSDVAWRTGQFSEAAKCLDRALHTEEARESRTMLHTRLVSAWRALLRNDTATSVSHLEAARSLHYEGSDRRSVILFGLCEGRLAHLEGRLDVARDRLSIPGLVEWSAPTYALRARCLLLETRVSLGLDVGESLRELDRLDTVADRLGGLRFTAISAFTKSLIYEHIGRYDEALDTVRVSADLAAAHSPGYDLLRALNRIVHLVRLRGRSGFDLGPYLSRLGTLESAAAKYIDAM